MSNQHALRLPSQAAWFFVLAPPVLARLFDPNCSSAPSNMLRAWFAVTVFAVLSGFALHTGFSALEKRIAHIAVIPRLFVHTAVTAGLIAAAGVLLFPCVRTIYPEVGASFAAVLWRAELVGFLYLGTVLCIDFFATRAARENTRAEHQTQAAADARLGQLQAQLSPHFLFNSLNVCAGLVHSAPDTAEKTLDKLSYFLRYSLESAQKKTVPLTRELEAMQMYLDIQRERFGHGESPHIEVGVEDPDTIEIPPMLLQPLLENAILFGHQAGGEDDLQIAISRVGERVSVRIENTIAAHSRTSGTGIGQAFVRERLRALYGDAATFVGEKRGQRYVVEVFFPRTA